MSKGKKKCEKCEHETGPRSKTCPKCSHVFKKKHRKPKVLSGGGRGRKTCTHCGTVQGVRVKFCTICHKPFQFVPSSMKEKRTLVNWRELEPGYHIRVIVGSGPYWPTENEWGFEEKIHMGYYGIYTVKQLAKDGIHAYPVSKHEAGHCFIYMGETVKSDTGLIRAAHKIVKVKRKIRP